MIGCQSLDFLDYSTLLNKQYIMEKLEIILIVLMILGALVSMIIGKPMKNHLLEQTEIKNIGLFQMPFYIKDYHKMISETTDVSKKKKYQNFFLIFMISNLGFFVSGIILILIPGSSF
jgi:hypothetical protein